MASSKTELTLMMQTWLGKADIPLKLVGLAVRGKPRKGPVGQHLTSGTSLPSKTAVVLAMDKEKRWSRNADIRSREH